MQFKNWWRIGSKIFYCFNSSIEWKFYLNGKRKFIEIGIKIQDKIKVEKKISVQKLLEKIEENEDKKANST